MIAFVIALVYNSAHRYPLTRPPTYTPTHTYVRASFMPLFTAREHLKIWKSKLWKSVRKWLQFFLHPPLPLSLFLSLSRCPPAKAHWTVQIASNLIFTSFISSFFFPLLFHLRNRPRPFSRPARCRAYARVKLCVIPKSAHSTFPSSNFILELKCHKHTRSHTHPLTHTHW